MKTLPIDINTRINKNLQTQGNNADPQMQVLVARAKSSIQDASYFTVENIRTKEGLTDVSVATRRMRPYGAPDGLFAIHIDNGTAKCLERAYPDKLQLRWQDAFEIGPATAVAIALDGSWGRVRQLWQLVTVEYPEIFWVDMDGILWTQHWDDGTSKRQLATDVLKIKAIRSWRSVFVRMNDTGIIVAYIKTDGTVWYKGFTEQETGPRAWEGETQVSGFAGMAATLNLFLTNDYRTGIAVEDSTGDMQWFISSRNWAGMAIGVDTIIANSPRAAVLLHEIQYYSRYHREPDSLLTATPFASVEYLYAATENEIVQVMNVPMARLDEEDVEYQDWGFAIEFRFAHELMYTPIVTLRDVVNTSVYTTLELEVVETGYEYRLSIDDENLVYGFNIAEGALRLEFNTLYNPAGYVYNILDKEFTPINLVPPIDPIPEVEVIWNE